MENSSVRVKLPAILLGGVLFLAACSTDPPKKMKEVPLEVPRGFVAELAIEIENQRYFFGPFVGYYFRPASPDDLNHLKFVCFNEKGFYTDGLPRNALLYKGEAIFGRLDSDRGDIPAHGERIRPVFFDQAPATWLAGRPAPRDEFLHFHSCYNAQGATLHGYWLRHRAVADFSYNMGGRLSPESILYHQVKKGVDRDFARIVEFDMGPE